MNHVNLFKVETQNKCVNRALDADPTALLVNDLTPLGNRILTQLAKLSDAEPILGLEFQEVINSHRTCRNALPFPHASHL